MRNFNKKPLYRKVNTTAHNVKHFDGGSYRDNRNQKKQDSVTMKKGVQRGLDYTSLFKFLLSKIGKSWDAVHSEAVARLDKAEPLYWMVALHDEDKKDYFLAGESSYYNGLYVDDMGILQKVNTSFNETTLEPGCKCCTHTFNGVVFSKKFKVL